MKHPVVTNGDFGFSQKEIGAESVAISKHSRRHFVSYVMYISGARFEEHCFNISGDIFERVFQGAFHSTKNFGLSFRNFDMSN